MFLVLGALNVTRLHYLLGSPVFTLGIFAVGCAGAGVMISRERERQYLPLYEAMPSNRRRAFGFAIFAIFALAVVASMLPVESHAEPKKSLTCPPRAEETTAQCS